MTTLCASRVRLLNALFSSVSASKSPEASLGSRLATSQSSQMMNCAQTAQ